MKVKILTKDGVSYLFPFILITTCFALWGFANDMTGPIVKAFSKIFRTSVTEGALVLVAFYLGYFAMAFPAAKFIQRYSFKAGVMVGLSLFAIGSFLFFPAKLIGAYYPFLLAYFILTCGLSFLETSSNPYIYCMGSEDTGTRRLNLAQAFNPIGALMGMYVAMQFVQARMSGMTTQQRMRLPEVQFNMLKDNDLEVLIGPYLGLGVICLILLVIIFIRKMPKAGETG
ncbi:MAG: L-fucose:H+ symporter permease, partial [Prevotella sp.]|nr:L-fucose:H+ symporter permease [Prevotella sp.]